jgi:hypothetical protein
VRWSSNPIKVKRWNFMSFVPNATSIEMAPLWQYDSMHSHWVGVWIPMVNGIWILVLVLRWGSHGTSMSHHKEPTSTNAQSWPFCPLDGLRFFSWHQIGFITIHFFLLLTTIFLFLFLVIGHFSPTFDFGHNYPTHLLTFISTTPTLTPYLLSPTNIVALITSYPIDLSTILTTYPTKLTILLI